MSPGGFMTELKNDKESQENFYRDHEVSHNIDRNTKIMVTGADGFLGSRLADDLHKLCTVYRIGHSRLDITNRQDVYKRQPLRLILFVVLFLITFQSFCRPLFEIYDGTILSRRFPAVDGKILS